MDATCVDVMANKSRKGIGGRPRAVDKTVVVKLEMAFACGANVSEACKAAGVSRDAYYHFLKWEPEYADRFGLLRQEPVLQAKRNVAEAIANGCLETSRWLLERRDPAFSSKVRVGAAAAPDPVEQSGAEVRKQLQQLISSTKAA